MDLTAGEFLQRCGLEPLVDLQYALYPAQRNVLPRTHPELVEALEVAQKKGFAMDLNGWPKATPAEKAQDLYFSKEPELLDSGIYACFFMDEKDGVRIKAVMTPDCAETAATTALKAVFPAHQIDFIRSRH